MHGPATHEGENRLRSIPRLFRHDRKIDRPAVDAWWRSGLEAPDGQRKLSQSRRKADCRGIPCPSRLVVLEPDMDQTT